MHDPDVINQVISAANDRREIVRIEKNLNTFGFFTPSHKRLSSLDEKIVRIFVRENGGQRVEAKATILPSAKLGLPITADQDKYYAFQRIMEEDLREKGQITNPVCFTSARMLKQLGLKRSGKNYREIADWLERMTLTGIRSEGAVYFAGRKKYGRDTFTVFTRSVTVGQEMPDAR
jgi:Replication initiator protein A